VTDDCSKSFQWTKDEENRLNELNVTCKLLQLREGWTWGALHHTAQGWYNDDRMQFCVTEEYSWNATVPVDWIISWDSASWVNVLLWLLSWEPKECEGDRKVCRSLGTG